MASLTLTISKLSLPKYVSIGINGISSPEHSWVLFSITSPYSNMAFRSRLLHELCSRRTSIRSFNRPTSFPLSDSTPVVAKINHSLNFKSTFVIFRSSLLPNQPSLTKLKFTGSRLYCVGRIVGFSVAYGIASSSSCVAFAMTGDDRDVDESKVTTEAYSDSVNDKDQLALREFVRKVWIPSLFLVNVVMMSWNSPIEFAIKFMLALFTTNPNPLSVYIYVEQLCDQYKREHPWTETSKIVKAKHVDVMDFGLFCFARVEILDQSFILFGILGAWWVWPSHLNHYLQFQIGFDEIKNRARQRLSLQLESDPYPPNDLSLGDWLPDSR